MALNLTSTLNSVLPGFSGNSSKASSLIRDMMEGKLSTATRNSIYSAGAERGVLGGMPGSTTTGGSLFANNDLKNIGLASDARQQQGIQDFLALLQGISGTVVPTAGQQLSDDASRRELAFRQGEANRDYGLKQNQQDLQAAEFNQRYGPREFSRTTGKTIPGYEDYQLFVSPDGRTSNQRSSLLFKYRT